MSDTSNLAKNYEPSVIEGAIYQLWLRSGGFAATPDERPPERRYVIMMPLPNVTGALHMGHAMDNVMQDLLTRWHRMMGDNALWQPGTDHAGIATQAVVEKRLKELEGKTRHDVGRDGLVQRIWQWKDQYQARIIEQQQRMGCSCDWRRQRFTMDAVCARAVRQAFFRMFEDGLIYRGKRLVNWDVQLQTSVSDDEVYHETVPGHFWHLRYPVIDPQPGEPEQVVVATTRPETMLGDTAVAVHPDPAAALDAVIARAREAVERAPAKERAGAEEEVARLQERKVAVLPQLIRLRDMARAGRQVRLPVLDRPIPLICDEWAKPELGSGCVKITPAHDANDYAVWTRHASEIEIINILEPQGTLNEAAGPYVGLDRYAARERVVADLDRLGLLAQVEDRQVDIGHSDRSKTPIEPFLSDQWFVRMGDIPGGVQMGRGTDRAFISPGLVQAAMDAVTDGRVSIHPERYTKTYLDWLAEKRDWPISRQLWWGHQIPVWSKQTTVGSLDLAAVTTLLKEPGAAARLIARVHWLDRGGSSRVTAEGLEGSLPAATDERCSLDLCLLDDQDPWAEQLAAGGYTRDPDVLDTWFSSALWPFSTLGWPDPQNAAIDPDQAPLGAQAGRPDSLSFYYPGSCLVTGRDIITLWVARMVLAGLYNVGDIPFSDVFIHANILDGNGERMSKSKGNGIDPVDIIETYGTDAMRYVLCDMQTGTQDIRLPVTAVCPRCGHHNDLAQTKTGKSIFIRICKSCGGEFDVLGTIDELPAGKLISERFESGRSFCTKLWNSMRFALDNLQGETLDPGELDVTQLEREDLWVLDGLNEAVKAVQQGLEEYNPSAAINAAREFFWGALCDWYLELIKPRLAQTGSATAARAQRVLAYCMDQVLRLFHPFIPFITEHLWQRLAQIAPERGLADLAPISQSPQLIAAEWPRPRVELEQPALRASFAELQQLVRAVRDVRTSAGVSPRESVDVTLRAPEAQKAALEQQGYVLRHLARVERLTIDPKATRQAGAAVKAIGELEIYVHDVIDDTAERERLTQQRSKVQKELTACERKLSNPKFVERAPEAVVNEQRERLAHYRASLETIERTLAQLG
jgi:valyl-tRNA synthetase